MNPLEFPSLERSEPLQRVRTAHEAAILFYPKLAEHGNAFLEVESGHHEFPYLELLDLNDDFWACTLGSLGTSTHPIVFVPEENQFRRFQPHTGLYEPILESALIGELSMNLDQCADFFPQRLRVSSYLALKNRSRLKAVVERAKDLLAVTQTFFQEHKPYHLALKNGLLNVSTNILTAFTPTQPVRETLPLFYDPQARCDLFLNSFLRHVLSLEDIDLLQRYCSQILEGVNPSQTMLILTGDTGWGKSTLMKIVGGMLGWQHVGIIREHLFKSEYELSHYQAKHFLYHPDMPTAFLDRREAGLFKSLCGGDPLWTETKASSAMVTLEGTFPIFLACNGKPKIRIDADADAWLRRLVVIPFNKPHHDQHLGKLAEMLLKTESSGILNWMLEGRARLVQDKFQMLQTPAQKRRAATLLMASESPQAFVRCGIRKKTGSVLLMADLYERYLKWCREHSLPPFIGREFLDVARTEIETLYGLRPRHDLEGDNGKARRGYSGLAVVDVENTENLQNQSALSA